MVKKEQKKVDKVEEAQKTLMEAQKKKQEAFIEDYRKLCLKHELELVPVTSFDIRQVRKQ